MTMISGLLLTVCLCGVVFGATSGPAPPYNLQCDRNFVGLGIEELRSVEGRYHFATENPNPTLSWTIRHSERSAYQKAFRVVVSRKSDLSRSSTGDLVWDTGVVTGTQQEIVYRGEALKTGEHYYWKVSWWDHVGKRAESKETGHFLAATDVQWTNVSWITQRNEDYEIGNGYKFVKKIDLTGKKVQKAQLYVSGLGYFRTYVNDHDLHQSSDPPIFLAPGWTNYEVRVGYLAFDVTQLLKTPPTEAVLSVCVGEGRRNRTEFPSKEPIFTAAYLNDAIDRLVRAQLLIDFSDGNESMVVKTDDTWEVHTMNIIGSSVYNGEVYNALVTDTVIGMASEVPGPAGAMYLAIIPPIMETAYDSPVEIKQLKSDPSKQIVDFGVNFAGVVKINVADVAKEHVIAMEHAEVLMHPPYGAYDGSLYTDNLRGAQQLDVYISNGQEKFYQPAFTYHGFRYVSVANYPRNLTVNDVKKVRISTNVKTNSKFHSSTELLMKIQENVVRGQASNMMTIPTDCDQRTERLGWMGDVGLSADSMAMNFQLQSYFPHRIMIIKDDDINGSVPDVTPLYHGGRRPADPSWSAAYPQLVWVLMKQYNDMATVRQYYPSMIEYLAFMEKLIPPGGIGNLSGPYGDWVPPPQHIKIANQFPSAFSLLLNIKQVLEMANVMKDMNSVSSLSSLFYKHTGEFNTAFLVNGKYLDDLQISYALPLYLDIVPDEFVKNVSVRFVNIFSDVDKYHITAGIIGTKFILPVLTKLNQNNAAIQCVNLIDYPSYGYMIHSQYEPATTIWELWNSDTGGPGMNSRNHHMFSSVSGWMQTGMIGFQQVEGTYGYKEMDLYPASALDLSAASIQLEYPKPIKYSYHRKGGLQCGKAAEDRSELNPNLPKHDGLVIKCGEGAVSKVLFASYGNPVGVCGYHRYGECHSPKSMSVVEKLCLNKSECVIQTGGDFWGDPCPHQVEVKWLTVAVQCSRSDYSDDSQTELLNRYTSLSVDVSVPMYSTAHVNIPAYGLDDLRVWDGETLVYSENRLLSATKGILSANWITERDLLKMDITSGDYSFTVKGRSPSETKTLIVNGWEKDQAVLQCTNERHVISRIDWVSYGNPRTDEYGSPMLGTYHSHASQMIVENYCVGKSTCAVPMDKDLFFNGSPHQFKAAAGSWNLVVKFSCNSRGQY